jgi:PIN domain nuclease of toxin-antitoxin system
MRLLLDTHAFLQRLSGKPFPRQTERMFLKSSTECLVSIVTGWEIVMKPKLGRSAADVEVAIAEMRAALLPIKFRHLTEYSHLPFHEHHRDPFDRMLIAQAIAEDLTVISDDQRFGNYERLRVEWD